MPDNTTLDPFAFARGGDDTKDTVLLALFAEYERVYNLSCEAAEREQDDEAHRLSDEACELERRIEGIRPCTLPGALKMLERGLWLSRDIDPPASHPMIVQALACLREFAGPPKPMSAEETAAFEFEPYDPESIALMVRDFSEPKWSAECREHGIALRIATTLLEVAKPDLADKTEAMERDFSGDGAGPTAEIMDILRHARDRLGGLSKLLDKTIARLAVAAAVIELRSSGGDQ